MLSRVGADLVQEELPATQSSVCEHRVEKPFWASSLTGGERSDDSLDVGDEGESQLENLASTIRDRLCTEV